MDTIPLHLQAGCLLDANFRGMPPSKSWVGALKWLKDDANMFAAWLIKRSNGCVARALKLAAQYGDVSTVKVLLTRNPNRVSALTASVIKGHVDVLHELLRGAQLDTSDANTLLGLAVVHNQTDLIKVFMDAGASVDGSNLDMVVRTQNIGSVKLMIDMSEPGTLCFDRAFTSAVSLGNIKIMQLLSAVAEGASVPIDMGVALGNAVVDNRVDMVRRLFKMGASPSSDRLFRHAALAGKAEIVQMFLKAGADARVITKWYMDRIRARGHHKVERMLLGSNAMPSFVKGLLLGLTLSVPLFWATSPDPV